MKIAIHVECTDSGVIPRSHVICDEIACTESLRDLVLRQIADAMRDTLRRTKPMCIK